MATQAWNAEERHQGQHQLYQRENSKPKISIAQNVENKTRKPNAMTPKMPNIKNLEMNRFSIVETEDSNMDGISKPECCNDGHISCD